MKSIKTKLLLVILSILLGFSALLIVANTFFLDDYYVFKTKSSFVNISGRVINEYESNPSGILSFIREENSLTGYKIVIADNKNVIHYSSVPEFKKNTNQKIGSYQREIITYNRDSINEGYFYGTGLDENKGYSSVILIDRLPDGLFLIITQPLHQLTESARTANSFFLICGAAMLVMAAVVSLVFSSRLVRPVIEITKITKSIQNLDFSVVYEGRSKDEIGVLGNGINSISEKLSNTISELKSRNEELKNEMQLQKRFIASISHEFNTPVGLIRGYTEALEKRMYKNEDERTEMAGIIISEADKLNRLVSDVLMMAKLDSNKFSLNRMTTDMGTLIAGSIDKLMPLAQLKGIKLTAENPGPVILNIDGTRITQVLDNLLNNALAHTSEFGDICVSCNAGSGSADVSIFNTGRNIPDEHISHLFDAFYQSDDSRTDTGTGLGLSVVKSIITAHGGSCGVRNVPSGVEFWFSLPF